MADDDPLLPPLSPRPSGAEQWQQAIAQQQQRDLEAPSTGEQVGDIINRMLWGTPIGGTRRLYEDISAGRLDPLSPEAAGRSLWTVLGLSSFLRPPTFEGGVPREMALPEEWKPTPIDPLKEAQWNVQLQRVGRTGDAMRHAWDIENKAPAEQFDQYLDHIDRLYGTAPYRTREDIQAQIDTPLDELLQTERPQADALSSDYAPGSLSGLTRAMQVPSRFVAPQARRQAVLDKLIANEDFNPIMHEGKLHFASLDAAENEEINRIGWSRAPDVTSEMETGPDKQAAWRQNIAYWRQLASGQ